LKKEEDPRSQEVFGSVKKKCSRPNSEAMTKD